MIAGTAKHLTSATQVALLGGSFTPDQITSKLQMLVNLRADVDAAKATTKAKIATEATQMPALRAFMSAFESYVKAAFGTSPDVLADFGITPKARAPAHGRGEGGGCREARGNARGAAHDGIEAEEGNQGRRHRRRRDPDHCSGSRRDGTE